MLSVAKVGGSNGLVEDISASLGRRNQGGREWTMLMPVCGLPVIGRFILTHQENRIEKHLLTTGGALAE